jgi:cellulose synthase/poly-beta-1,6-N-acetylglucosamine synthase-like glycosyltransferase
MDVIAVALLAIVLLAYTYVGYPLVIGALARASSRRASAPNPAGPTPLVSVCLPVFNGAKFLPAKIGSLLAQDYPAERIEILIFCDGCTDDSEETARRLAASEAAGARIRVFASPVRKGKPAALNALGAEARGELLLLNDVRQPFSSNAVRALVRALDDEGVGCAAGTLVLRGEAASGVYWRYENWIRRRESCFRGVVGMSGAIAMMRRADLMPLATDLILDDVYIPMQLALRGRRVALVTEAEAYDVAFEDEHEFRRKVRTLAGNYQLFALMPALLVPFRNPIWFEVTSHKLMRLVAPWLMLLVALASIAGALPGNPPMTTMVMRLLLLAQLAFYGAAAAGRRSGRVGGVARTFVVLNAAAIVGLFRQLAGRQRVTW